MPGRPPATDADLRAILSLGSIGTLDDDALLDLFERRAGDPSADRAFEALIQRHGALVLRVARGRLASEEDARDAFQATFWLLARKSRSIRNRATLAGWLCGVASRLAARAAVEAARRRARERRAALPLEDTATDPARIEPDLLPAIAAEIAHLPAHYRAPVILCDLEGLSYDEAAHRLGCPVGTFKARLSRARSRLRTRLTARGLAPADWPAPAPRPLLVPFPLIQAACRLALSTTPSAGPPAAAVASIITLAQGASRTMIFTSIPAWAALTLAATVGTAVVADYFTAGGGSQDPARVAGPDPTRPLAPEPQPTPPRPPTPALAGSPVPLSPDLRRAVFNRALAAAVVIADAPNRTEALLRIGRSQTAQGDREGARDTLLKALVAMKSGKPNEMWTIPHPLARIAEALALNGDKAEAHQTFEQAIEVIETLPDQRRFDDFAAAILTRQRVEGRAASQTLVAAYRRNLLERQGPIVQILPLTETVRLGCLMGQFPEMLNLIRQSPDLQAPDHKSLSVDAFFAMAGTLLPDDPASLIDSVLGQAHQSVLELPESLSKFNLMRNLTQTESKLGRFELAEELANRCAAWMPGEDTVRTDPISFQQAMCFINLAGEENEAGRFAQAGRLAKRGAEVALKTGTPSYLVHPVTQALSVMLDAGDEAGAIRIEESMPAGLFRWNFSWVIRSHFEKQGKEAEARHWTRKTVAQIDQALNRPPGTAPLEVWEVAYLTRTRRELEWADADLPRMLRDVEALPAADRLGAQRTAAQVLTRSGRVAEALTLAGQITDPKEQREIEILIATTLPAPPKPPAVQSPRSDAAR